jgi:hypothetical protein
VFSLFVDMRRATTVFSWVDPPQRLIVGIPKLPRDISLPSYDTITLKNMNRFCALHALLLAGARQLSLSLGFVVKPVTVTFTSASVNRWTIAAHHLHQSDTVDEFVLKEKYSLTSRREWLKTTSGVAALGGCIAVVPQVANARYVLDEETGTACGKELPTEIFLFFLMNACSTFSFVSFYR